MNTNDLVKDTIEIDSKFKKKMDKRARMLDLVEEVGELANAILMVEGDKNSGNPDKKRTKADIADALADILFDLVLLGDAYDIALFDEYKQMLDKMKERFASGDLVG